MPGPGHTDGGVFMERAGTLAPSSRGLCFDPFFSHGLRVAAFLGSVDSGSRWMVALAGVQAAALAVILKSAGDGASTSSTNSRLGVSGLRAAIILWDSSLGTHWHYWRRNIALLDARTTPQPIQKKRIYSVCAGSLGLTGGATLLGSLFGVCLKAGALVFGTGRDRADVGSRFSDAHWVDHV